MIQKHSIDYDYLKDLEPLGFKNLDAGGNTTAFFVESPDGVLVITDRDGIGAPENLGTPVLVGKYKTIDGFGNGESGEFRTFATFQSFLTKFKENLKAA